MDTCLKTISIFVFVTRFFIKKRVIFYFFLSFCTAFLFIEIMNFYNYGPGSPNTMVSTKDRHVFSTALDINEFEMDKVHFNILKDLWESKNNKDNPYKPFLEKISSQRILRI